jgi:pimeloyl-ACP methyl ester carboxylesterase
MRDAEVRFAKHGDGDYLAFSLFGEGPHDLLVDPRHFPDRLDVGAAAAGRVPESLGRFARVIVFDRRARRVGPCSGAWGVAAEAHSDGLLSVLDAADSDRATVLALGGTGTALSSAAMFPDRIRSVILAHFRPSFPEFRDVSAAQLKKIAMRLRSPEWLRVRDPRVAHDPCCNGGGGVRLAQDQSGRDCAGDGGRASR